MPTPLHTKSQPGWTLDLRNPRMIEDLMPWWGWLYHHYFRVQTSGWHHMPSAGPVLVVGSHNGGLAAPDLHMVMHDWFQRFGTERPAYGLLHAGIWTAFQKLHPPLTDWLAHVGAVMAHPQMAIAALRRGASVLVYPGGAQDTFRPHAQRHEIYLAGRVGFIKLALREQVPIVPIVSQGAHDTLVVLADIYEFMRQLNTWGMPWFLDVNPEVFPIYLGLPWGLAIGPLPNLPLPVTIQTKVCPPIWFERYGSEAVRDRAYVTQCYEIVQAQMQSALDDLVGSPPS